MGGERGHFGWFEEVTSEQRPDRWKEPAMGRFGEKWSRLGHDRCKGPEVGRSWPVLRIEGRLEWLEASHQMW